VAVGVKPVTVIVSAEDPNVLSIHPSEVKVPAQVPLNTWRTASDKVAGVTVTICEEEVATKLYQTSSSAVPAQPVWD
jgi:hypothetical protein